MVSVSSKRFPKYFFGSLDKGDPNVPIDFLDYYQKIFIKFGTNTLLGHFAEFIQENMNEYILSDDSNLIEDFLKKLATQSWQLILTSILFLRKNEDDGIHHEQFLLNREETNDQIINYVPNDST
jgi:hypothetical protein